MTTDQPVLFDLVPTDDREVCPGPHVLMPNMAYACGGSILTKTGGFLVGVGNEEDLARVGCPDCRTPGYPSLRARIHAQTTGGGGPR